MPMFTQEELRHLAARASTIDERLNGGYVANGSTAGSRRAVKRLKAWCRSAAAGDDALFRGRLARAGLDVEAILPLLGDVRLIDGHPTPGWIENFGWIADALQADKTTAAPAALLEEDRPIPFEDLFVPLVAAARERRDRRIKSCAPLLSETAHTMLQRALLRRLSSLCARTLFSRFSIFRFLRQPMSPLLAFPGPRIVSRSLYKPFIAETRANGLRQYFIDHPVIARLLATIEQNWIDTTGEMISRLGDDLAELSQSFNGGAGLGSVTAVECDLSDPHQGGRAVCILSFDAGPRIVYKPKALGLDVAWGRLLRELERRGAPASALAPKVLRRRDYGWVEFVEPESCLDEAMVRHFFRRAGSTLCLLYLLQGTDFHFENVIAKGDHPILIDLETLMHPWVAQRIPVRGPRGAIACAASRLRNSVLATSYLPNWTVVPAGQVAGMGGLGPIELYRLPSWRFRAINTDNMVLDGESRTIEETAHHLPTIRGKRASSASYKEDILAGFVAMYRFFVHNHAVAGSLLADFEAQSVRVILRPTEVYALLLSRSLETNHLCDGAEWSLHFDFLSRFSRWDEEYDPLRLVIRAEHCALASLDIPFFTTRSDVTSLEIPNEQKVLQYFEQPSIAQVRDRIDNLSEIDLEIQKAFIAAAVEATGDDIRSQSAEPWGGRFSQRSEQDWTSPFMDQACDLATGIMQGAICANGGAAWLGLVPLPGERRAQLEVIGYDLYSGASGVALFLAALESIIGAGTHRPLALAALAPLREDLSSRERGTLLARIMGIGGGSGLGSVIYALVRSAALLSDDSLLEDARRAAVLISDERISADKTLDVLGGAAGAILGLLALHRASDVTTALERANACGQHLLRKRRSVNGVAAWQTMGDTPLAGFSHGAAGIAYALLRLYEACGESEFLEAALDGMAYERTIFSQDERNWPDFRDSDGEQRTFLCQWCHGAAGIGLARIGGLSLSNDNLVAGEIEAALETTTGAPCMPLDSLCCGNFGRLETVLSAGRVLNRPQLVELAKSRALQLISVRRSSGFSWTTGTNAQNPGFFTGVSGVGYQLLRLARPDSLPSVLLWE